MEDSEKITPYLFTFKPINRFFFGSSYSLGEGFFAESLRFPQPTTILGCIRNTILAQNKLMNITTIAREDFLGTNKVQELTGTSKIEKLSDPGHDFGVIDRISPVFLVKHSKDKLEDALFPVPDNVVLDECSSLTCYEYEKKDNAKSSYSGRETEYAILSSKKPKSFKANRYGDKSFWHAYLNKKLIPYNSTFREENIFNIFQNVGIERENRKIKLGAFYLKIEYSLKEDFSFGVIVWLKNDFHLEDCIVILGGEQSTFLLKIFKDYENLLSNPVIHRIVKENCNLTDNLKSCTDKEKLVALSPIILDKESYIIFAKSMEHCVISGIQSTRTVSRANGKNKSEAIRMIPMGSVFYPLKQIDINFNWPIPYKIGYNYILKIERR